MKGVLIRGFEIEVYWDDLGVHFVWSDGTPMGIERSQALAHLLFKKLATLSPLNERSDAIRQTNGTEKDAAH